ncbi:MAG TPA: LytTR family DNA-binding domain-containing protein [Steroidobacteraceae bacterium]|jgi:two-component system LytT family response regulator
MKLLIVDEEPAARADFTQLCRKTIDLHIVGEAQSGGAAIDAVESLSPDVMLIDVTLPDMSGFEVLRLAGGSTGPLGIMTSRQSDYVERALEEGAVDCLTKPVSANRFAQAINRARQRYMLANASQAPLARHVHRVPGRRPKLLIGERQHRLYPLDIEKIDYIEADGNYVTIRAGNAEYISRDSIKRLSMDLADFGFMRIDRSTILNIRAVAFAEPIGHGALTFTLSSGACLHSSKAYRKSILRVLPWHHCRSGANL